VSDELELQGGGVAPADQLLLLEHGGARLVAGLFWQVLSRPREALKEAKELGESMSFDFMVQRSAGAVMQAGFAAQVDGAVEGMASLAMLIAATIEAPENGDIPQNWLAAVELPGGQFAYAAVRDGAFLPDADFAGSKEDVLARLTSDYALGEWELVVAPNEFGFANSHERRFDEVAPLDKKGKYKPPAQSLVQPVRRTLPWKKIGIVVSALVAIGVCAQVAKGYYEDKAAAEREVALQAEETRLAEEMRNKALSRPPWANVADTADLLTKCEQMMFQIPFTPVGWAIGDLACSREGSVVASYTRGDDGAPIYVLKKLLGANVRFDWRGEQAIYTSKIELKMADRESLWFADEAVNELVGRFQSVGVPLDPKDEMAGTPGVGGPAGPIKFRRITFSASTKIKPSFYAKLFAVPGVRIKGVKVSPAGVWTTEGEIYVEPSK
jgi:hypothetical protein